MFLAEDYGTRIVSKAREKDNVWGVTQEGKRCAAQLMSPLKQVSAGQRKASDFWLGAQKGLLLSA
jgi:hypothetical protein